jgi:hypothetical protein
VVSPGSRHWGESEFIKLRGEVMVKLKYFPLWSEQELFEARPFLDNDLSEEGVLERYREFAECLVVSFLLEQKYSIRSRTMTYRISPSIRRAGLPLRKSLHWTP